MSEMEGGMDELFDVLEVKIGEPITVRILATAMSGAAADDFIKMAVFRRGVETHFFTKKPAGEFKDGDTID